MTRRVFLKAGAMAMLSLGFAPPFLARAAAAVKGRRRLLIAIFQRGAADGLNMVVPYGEPEYYRLRPSIAVPRPDPSARSALDLDGFFGLHPSLAPLQPLWGAKTLAIVHACGSPNATRSHFDAQDYMESATPGIKSTRDGWLNRYLRLSADEADPLRGVALTRQMPRSLQGEAPVLAIGRMEEFRVRDSEGTRASFEETYRNAADSLLTRAGSEAFDAMRTLRDVTATRMSAPGDASFPRSPFGQALREIAKLATADVGLEIAFAETGNWDHHVNEGGVDGQLATRLDDFARSLSALVAALADRLDETVILTMSEFGRSAAENGNRGTDHGHGNAMFVIGGPVRGGQVYGRWPGLKASDRFEGRDLAVTTDFRDVFSDIVAQHLGASKDALDHLFPGFRRGRSPRLIA